MEYRVLGTSALRVSAVAMGCWPISGMTSLGVTHEASRQTLRAARDAGINFFDTAYCYGAQGESERLIAEELRGERQQLIIATKGGIHWDPQGTRINDASPARLQRECEESLERLQTDYIDLLYLHSPDKQTPIEESALALRRLLEAGKTRTVGVSNVSLAQAQAFHAACPLTAIQPPYNMLMRHIEADLIPWCLQQQIAVVPYWPLMKGLLAGKLPREHRFEAGDGRPKYAAFQGAEWTRNQDFVDDLRVIAADAGRTVSQLVVHWTIHQPGIVAALCGAKRPEQITETAASCDWQLTAAQQAAIERAFARRGASVKISAV